MHEVRHPADFPEHRPVHRARKLSRALSTNAPFRADFRNGPAVNARNCLTMVALGFVALLAGCGERSANRTVADQVDGAAASFDAASTSAPVAEAEAPAGYYVNPDADADERADDHPLVRPYAGSTQRDRERQFAAYDEYERVVGVDGSRLQLQRLEGRLTRLVYDNPDGRSTLEILRNYRNALTGNGLRIDFECQGSDACGHLALSEDGRYWHAVNEIYASAEMRYLTGRMRQGQTDVYVSIAAVADRHWVHVLETVPMESGLVEVNRPR